MSPYQILDVGCGMRKRPDAVGIDVNPRSQADVIHDLNSFPYPFPENQFDEVICDNVLEHLDDILKVMEEIYRIARPGAKVIVIVPFHAHRNARTDPTHKHFFGLHSFDYFIEGTDHSRYRYSAARFELISKEFEKDAAQKHLFDRIIRRFANARMDVYENRFANIFPLRSITFELRVAK